MRTGGSCSCRSAHRPTTSSAVIARDRTCSATRWWRSMPRPVIAAGMRSWCTTICGTSTRRRSPSWPTFRTRAAREPCVVQVTKMGLVFVFDRMTGEPVFGIEERAVPPSDVPGEQASPTQPFPVRPPPLSRHTPLTRDDLTTVTAESRRECDALFAKRAQRRALHAAWPRADAVVSRDDGRRHLVGRRRRPR